MMRPRAANDFAAIRTRIEELRRERVQAARDNAPERTDEVYRRSQEPAGKREPGHLGEPHRR
jgi:hypothetical protein